jgi:hypothetical protein
MSWLERTEATLAMSFTRSALACAAANRATAITAAREKSTKGFMIDVDSLIGLDLAQTGPTVKKAKK